MSTCIGLSNAYVNLSWGGVAGNVMVMKCQTLLAYLIPKSVFLYFKGG